MMKRPKSFPCAGHSSLHIRGKGKEKIDTPTSTVSWVWGMMKIKSQDDFDTFL